MNPLTAIICQEQALAVHRAIRALPPDEADLISKFLNEESVESEQLEGVIIKLQRQDFALESP